MNGARNRLTNHSSRFLFARRLDPSLPWHRGLPRNANAVIVFARIVKTAKREAETWAGLQRDQQVSGSSKLRWLWLVLAVLVPALSGCATESEPEMDDRPPVKPATWSAWTPPCSECPQVVDSADAFEPAIAVDGERVIAVHTPFKNGLRTLHVVTSNGANWTVHEPFPLDRFNEYPAFAGCREFFDPSVTVHDGRAVITTIAGVDSSTGDRVLAWFTFDGTNFSEPRVVTGGCDLEGNSIPDFAHLTAGPNGPALTWRHSRTGEENGWSWASLQDGFSRRNLVDVLKIGECEFLSMARGYWDGAWTWAGVGWNNIRVTEIHDVCIQTSVGLVSTGKAPFTWPKPFGPATVAVAYDGLNEVPVLYFADQSKPPLHLRALTSQGTTGPNAIENNGRIIVTAYRLTDEWEFVYAVSDDDYNARVVDGPSISTHNAGTTGMGHYHGLAPWQDGAIAAWAVGDTGQRQLVIGALG